MKKAYALSPVIATLSLNANKFLDLILAKVQKSPDLIDRISIQKKELELVCGAKLTSVQIQTHAQELCRAMTDAGIPLASEYNHGFLKVYIKTGDLRVLNPNGTNMRYYRFDISLISQIRSVYGYRLFNILKKSEFKSKKNGIVVIDIDRILTDMGLDLSPERRRDHLKNCLKPAIDAVRCIDPSISVSLQKSKIDRRRVDAIVTAFNKKLMPKETAHSAKRLLESPKKTVVEIKRSSNLDALMLDIIKKAL